MDYSHIKTDIISGGYIAYNGHVFTKEEAEGYNVYNDEIKRAIKLRDNTLINSLANRRAEYFKLVIGELE